MFVAHFNKLAAKTVGGRNVGKYQDCGSGAWISQYRGVFLVMTIIGVLMTVGCSRSVLSVSDLAFVPTGTDADWVIRNVVVRIDGESSYTLVGHKKSGGCWLSSASNVFGGRSLSITQAPSEVCKAEFGQ